MEAAVQDNVKDVVCPDSSERIEQRLHEAVHQVICFVKNDCDTLRLSGFEGALWPKVLLLYRLFVALFLAVRHERLDVSPYVQRGRSRLKKEFAERTIKTWGGPVRYGRTYVLNVVTQRGWFPLDAALGITQDGFSLRVVGMVTRLATRLSYAAARGVFQAFVGWSPSQEEIGRLVLGLGMRAAAYMDTGAPLPEPEGEVLVIEVDGKAAPMATQEELAARRGPRSKRAQACGCRRHRGRKARRSKPKKRRKKGDKSKNGKSATLVALYTLRRGEDGQLHGPVNKKVWGTFAGRRAAIRWARQEATRRGFPPGTDKRVQVVIDGEHTLRANLKELFPDAVFTLDLRHAQERLWKAGRVFHKEGSDELTRWVEPLNTLLLDGRIKTLLKRLQDARDGIARQGPNTKTRRETLQSQINYFQERVDMMKYDEYRRQDLVLATGVIEGACRYVVGERLDCSGMRWISERAEPLLHLRCVELNGDWPHFIQWIEEQYCRELEGGQLVQIQTNLPPPLRKAA